jgi:adenylate kinase
VIVVLLGPPGAGKGTQAARLVQDGGYQHISTGDILRSEVSRGTELGKKAKTFMDSGALVPDDLILAMICGHLGDRPVLFDGFPRTVAQAEGLDAMLAESNRRVDRVIEMRAERRTLIERLTGRRTCPNCMAVFHLQNAPPAVEGQCDACGWKLIQRRDDHEDVVTARLETFERQTQPLADYYRQMGVLAPVNADDDVEKVTAAIRAVIESGA